jgi:hypothetical protein
VRSASIKRQIDCDEGSALVDPDAEFFLEQRLTGDRAHRDGVTIVFDT